MIFEQNVVNCTPAQALAYGCDMFQPYMPGTKIGFSVRQGNWLMNTGPLVHKTGVLDARWTGFLLGVYNPVSEKVSFFDCWEADGVEVIKSPYRDRVMLLRTMQPYLVDWMNLTPSYRITDFTTFWSQNVPAIYPGVIFRKSHDPATSPRLVCTKNPEEFSPTVA